MKSIIIKKTICRTHFLISKNNNIVPIGNFPSIIENHDQLTLERHNMHDTLNSVLRKHPIWTHLRSSIFQLPASLRQKPVSRGQNGKPKRQNSCRLAPIIEGGEMRFEPTKWNAASLKRHPATNAFLLHSQYFSLCHYLLFLTISLVTQLSTTTTISLHIHVASTLCYKKELNWKNKEEKASYTQLPGSSEK